MDLYSDAQSFWINVCIMKNSSLASRIIYVANKRTYLRRIARLVLRYVFSCDVALPVKWGGVIRWNIMG